MKSIILTRKVIFAFAALTAFTPLFGQQSPAGKDSRNIPITANLIVDGSSGLKNALDEVSSWLSAGLIDGILAPGDKLTVWSAGSSARILYSDTIKTGSDKENIKKLLKTLPSQGNTADFSGALTQAAAGKGSGITYTVLISASQPALSSALSGSAANLLRYSRIEEFKGWRAMVIAMDIDSRVKQSASAFLSGI